MMNFKKVIVIVVMLLIVFSCGESYSPKPRGFFRIDLPEKEYRIFDSIFPYKFEYPVYAKINPDVSPSSEPYWADVVFPRFNAAIHLSYKSVKTQKDLQLYFEDSRTFANKQIPKATAIHEGLIIDPVGKVYGLTYEIQGTGAASTYQFYLTDSVKHFLRGALYFNFQPNNDSLAPVINFLKEDIEHLIGTLEWK
jgi:gliding motility-associated lipoprotein GldD